MFLSSMVRCSLSRLLLIPATLCSVLLVVHLYQRTCNHPLTPSVLPSSVQHHISFYERGVPNYKDSDVLLPFLETAPDTIHFIWCGTGDRFFQFRHYLSILSIFKNQQPNKVVIHYWSGFPLLKDKNDYNLWFWQLQEEYYNIVFRTRPGNRPDCLDEAALTEHIIDVLKGGGIYFNETTILNKQLHAYRKHHLVAGVFDKARPLTAFNLAFLIAKKQNITQEGLLTSQIHLCLKNGDVIQRDKTSVCALVEENLYPKDIMESKSAWSAMIRGVYYGSTSPRYPDYSMSDPIPEIGHMVLLGGWEMTMLTYLSIRSMIHCVGVEAMYIYIDTEPKGRWYEKLKVEEPRAVFVYHEWPETVFGIKMRDGSHASDLMRFDLLYRYGGIYVDWDAVMIKPLGDLRGYGFVTDFDWPDWHPPYPDVINNGVSASKKGSLFLKKSLQLFNKYNPDGDWYYNGLMMPYKLYEQFPELVKIEKRLQVICFNLKCHPVWLPSYHDENVNHLNGASFDWREVYAFHWTRPSPEELLDEDKLKVSTSMFAEVGRHILSCKRIDSKLSTGSG